MDPGATAERPVHGVLLRVHGVGVLLCGASGSGKSSLALELLDRGHRLVSDDAPLLRRSADGRLLGRSSPLLRGHLHVRGLGLLEVGRLFGAEAVVAEQRLELIVRLAATVSVEIGLEPDAQPCRLLGVELPEYRLVAQAGLNRALWVECAARQLRLRQTNHDPARALAERQQAIADGTPPCV